MTEAKYLHSVRDQYEDYPYPARDPEDEKRELKSSDTEFLDQVNHYCFKGRQSFRGARVLVAGGGTGDAAIFLAEQLRDKDATLVYLDVSRASMEVAQARAEVRGLTNIEWHLRSLLELPEMGLAPFDFISCTGVLHHLEDPKAGLSALRRVLKDDGAMGLMVYGAYGRTGVYQMQALLKLLLEDEPEPQAKVDVTKALLGSLPPTNWFKRAEDLTPDHKTMGDVGLYDLLLHSQDRAYTVPQLYELLDSAGLHLIEFGLGDKLFYRPQIYVQQPEVLERINRLDRRTQQTVAELLCGNRIKHACYAAPQDDTVASFDDMDNVPFFTLFEGEGLLRAVTQNPGQPIRISQHHGVQLQLTPGKYTGVILKYLDGNRSLAEIFDAAARELGGEVGPAELHQDFRPIYQALNDLDFMLLRHESVPAFPEPGTLQAAVSRRRRKR